MLTRSKAETQKLAARFAKKILQATSYRRYSGASKLQANVIALSGDLGAGKTTFVQGFSKALGIKYKITSPTFLIIRRYQVSSIKHRVFKNFFHFDLYRIHKAKELLDLGFGRILKDSHNILLIEWPEKIKKLLPKSTVWINFKHGKKENERSIRIST